MMLNPPMKDLLKKVPSRYELVNVVAARARQIASEAEENGVRLEEKPVSMAINEIAYSSDETTEEAPSAENG